MMNFSDMARSHFILSKIFYIHSTVKRKSNRYITEKTIIANVSKCLQNHKYTIDAKAIPISEK